MDVTITSPGGTSAPSPLDQFTFASATPTATSTLTATATFTPTPTITPSSTPTATATPSGPCAYAFVANFGDGTVSVINTLTNAIVGPSIPVEGSRSSPIGIAVSPDGCTGYVGLELANEVAVVNGSAGTATFIAGIPAPLGIAISPNGKTLYVVSNIASGVVSVIDTTTQTVAATIGVGVDPVAVAVSADGSQAFVSNSNGGIGNGTVSIINTATDAVTGTPIAVGAFASGIAVTPDGKYVLVTDMTGNSLSVITCSPAW